MLYNIPYLQKTLIWGCFLDSPGAQGDLISASQRPLRHQGKLKLNANNSTSSRSMRMAFAA